MNKIAITVSAMTFALLDLFLMSITSLAVVASVQEYAAQRMCANPLFSNLSVTIILCPILLLATYRGWKFAQKNKISETIFRGAFILSRALSIAAAIVILYICLKIFA